MTGLSILGFLKYASFALAAASAIWGLTTKTTVEDEQKRKRLTPAGHIAIAITMGSFLISAVSYGFETLKADAAKVAQDQKDRADLEDRTNAQARAEAQRRSDEAERRASEAERRADAADQRNVTLTASTESRSRDLELAREVNKGTRANLERTEAALGQLERVLQPLGKISVSVMWEIPGDTPGLRAATARLAEFGDRAKADRRLLETTPDLYPGGGGGKAISFTITPASNLYPRFGVDQSLFDVLHFATSNISVFAAGPSADAARAEIPEAPVRRRDGVADIGDLRFGLRTPDLPNFEYLTDTGAVRFVLSASVEPTAMKKTGAVVAIPDLEKSLVAFEFVNGGRLGASRPFGGAARPVFISFSTQGRTYRVPADRIRAVITSKGATVFAVQPLVVKSEPAPN